MNVKQKILIFLGSILAVAIMVSIWIINEKYSSDPITDEYKVKRTSIWSGKKNRKSLNIYVENEFEKLKFSPSKVKKWKWNLSDITDSLVYNKSYSELYDTYYPKKSEDKKIVLDHTSSLVITYRIGLFKTNIFDEVICVFNNYCYISIKV